MSAAENRSTSTKSEFEPSQIDRLRRMLTRSGLDPKEYLNKALDASLTKLGDSEIEQIVKTLIANSEESKRIAADKSKFQPGETFLRFNLAIRLQHALMALSIVILILTGLPIKYHQVGISKWLVDLIGGIEVSSVIHRVGATGLIVVGFIHLIYISFTKAGRKDFLLLLPRWKDLMDWIQMLKYYFHRTETKAKYGRFSYIEKFDYWAVYWGMIIMISSGSLLWFQEEALEFIPKYMMDIASEAHSDEALLATLAIVIWHFYNVHFTPAKFPMSKVFIDGLLTREEMEEEHPLELEEILAEQKKSGSQSSPKHGEKS